MTNNYYDFDLAWAESEGTGTPVKILGEQYIIPAELPISLVLRFMRIQGDHKMTAADMEKGGVLYELVDGIFGEGTLEKWIEKKITFQKLINIIEKVTNGFQQAATGDSAGGDETPLTS